MLKLPQGAEAAFRIEAIDAFENRFAINSSRLYSPAIARLTLLMIVEVGPPSFSNCSAQ